jgi:hypothetical protein
MSSLRKTLAATVAGFLVTAVALAMPKAAEASCISNCPCPLFSHVTHSFYYDGVDDGAISLYFYYANSATQKCIDVQEVVSVSTSGPSMVAPINAMVWVGECIGSSVLYITGNWANNLSTPRWEYSLALTQAVGNDTGNPNWAVFQYAFPPGGESTSFKGPGGHLYSTDNGNLPAEELQSPGCGF